MSVKRDGAAIVGMAAAACAVCCAAPILGFLAAVGLATAAGFTRFGVVGVLITLAIGVALYIRRRRRGSTCAPVPEVVQVERPRIRTSR